MHFLVIACVNCNMINDRPTQIIKISFQNIYYSILKTNSCSTSITLFTGDWYFISCKQTPQILRWMHTCYWVMADTKQEKAEYELPKEMKYPSHNRPRYEADSSTLKNKQSMCRIGNCLTVQHGWLPLTKRSMTPTKSMTFLTVRDSFKMKWMKQKT